MKYLDVCYISKPHGLKGEVKINIITDNLDRFKKGSILYLESTKEEIVINSFRQHKNAGLITFNNITNINDVLKYVGKKLLIKETQIETKENEYHYHNLIDCSIVVDSLKVGVVYDILEVPQGIILMVKLNDETNKLIPFVDEFVKDIDIVNKTIVITPIEGLL